MINSQIAQPQDVYTDLNSLQSINAIGREDKGEALRKVAEQFESMFVKMMMKSMRDANKVFQEDSIMHSPQEDFYQQMYDDQLSVSLTGKQGMGLADVIYRQINQEYGDPEGRKEVKWQPLDDRRKNFSHAIDFNQIEKKNTQLKPKKEQTGFEIDASFVNKAEKDTAPAKQVGKLQTFASPEAFIETLYPAAQKVAKEMGVSPQAIVSQAALETGWGKFVIHGENSQGEQENSFNFFGIKADSRWSGEKVSVTTHEDSPPCADRRRPDEIRFKSVLIALATHARARTNTWTGHRPRRPPLSRGVQPQERGWRERHHHHRAQAPAQGFAPGAGAGGGGGGGSRCLTGCRQ
jgi:flagellar protein FlgJ